MLLNHRGETPLACALNNCEEKVQKISTLFGNVHFTVQQAELLLKRGVAVDFNEFSGIPLHKFRSQMIRGEH